MIIKINLVYSLVVTVLLTTFSLGFAETVSIDKAEKVAINWYNYWSSSDDDKIVSSSISESISLQYEASNSIFVFTVEEDGGFVIVAADDSSIPVLGYSFNSRFDENLISNSDNIKFWIDKYHREINEIKNNKLSNTETSLKWNDILTNTFDLYPLSSKNGGKDVEPLITSTWNQGNPYNIYCPMDNGSRSVTGCVATAMAMIMQYYEHPSHGDGDYQYNWGSTPLYANFEETAYNWDEMTSSINSSSTPSAIHEVAQLSYHCGVAVDMGYGAGGSGAQSYKVATSLVSYFNYNNSVEYLNRNDYSTPNWIELLKNDLDLSQPLYYDGFSDSGGHAFICDGYQANDYFHFNWGWGGTDNGYFTVDALNTGAGAFNNWQSIINSIYPNEEDLIITESIPDIILSESSMVIDLSEHFESIGGNNITYSIEENSNSNAVTTSISSSNLTLTRGSENGISTIRVIANTSSEQFFDIFDIKITDTKPLAGFGNTYNFGGTSFADIGNNDIINDMSLLSISAWVKLNNLDNNHSIISKNSSTNSGWYFNINTINKIKFLVKAENGSSRKLYSLSTLPSGEWIHLAGTYDGHDLKIYINGVLDRENHFDEYQEIRQDEEINLYLGRSTSYYLDGNLDEVRLWNKGLSQNDIINSMNSILTGNENDLIGYWKLDENFGGMINDYSINNFDATIQGINNYNWLSSSSEIAPLRFCSYSSALTGNLLGNDSENIIYELINNASGQAILNNINTGEFIFTPSVSSSLEEFSYKIIENNVSSEEIKVYIDNDLVDIEDNYELSIMNYELKQNYPNPFNPVTEIRYSLSVTRNAVVEIVVYNSVGQEVWFSPITDHALRVTGSILFDGSKFNSGVYYYSLVVDGKKLSTKSMVLIK